MASVKSIVLAAVIAMPLAAASTAPPAKAGDAASVLLGIAAGVLVGTSSAPQPQQAPQSQQQPMRETDRLCLTEGDTIVCHSPVLREMRQRWHDTSTAYRDRLVQMSATAVLNDFDATMQQQGAQFQQCPRAPDPQGCIAGWFNYWTATYSARLAALSAPVPAPAPLRLGSADCRTVLADWQTKYFFRLHPGLTYDQGVAAVHQCAQHQPAVRPASYPPPTSPNRSVRIAGDISRATVDQFDEILRQQPAINTVILDSPGGSVSASADLAERIRNRGMTTVVEADAKCASACFMLFAAGAQRIASATARIGVHSASLDGEETSGSLGMSTLMARYCSLFGVPPAILGKMVTTTPETMAWLTAADLRSMQVDVQ